MILRKYARGIGIHSRRQFSSSSSAFEGLKVAFFGSDEVSIESLKKLVEISKQKKGIIDSIDVITKPPKSVGRYLKEVADVPIAEYAQSQGLNLIRAEKTSEINELAQNKYQMAVAVSYGKLIPKQFLEHVPYSLNVHPSLLPRYAGASPLQFALLNEDTYSGVTVQTLHPNKFDEGEIVDQTEQIPITECKTLESIRDKLAVEGATLLGKVIETESYKNPDFKSKYEASKAPKITSEFRKVHWEKPASKIIRQYEILGPLFTFKEIDVLKKKKRVHDWRRVIIHPSIILPNIEGFEPGQFQLQDDMVIIQTANGSIGTKSLKFEFEKEEDAPTFIQRLKKRAGTTENKFDYEPGKREV